MRRLGKHPQSFLVYYIKITMNRDRSSKRRANLRREEGRKRLDSPSAEGGITLFDPGRRRFLRLAVAVLAGLTLPAGRREAGAFGNMGNIVNGRAAGKGRDFAFAQLVYKGGEWDPEPRAVPSLLENLESTTSISALRHRVDLRLDSPDLFSYPFLYMTGTKEFLPFQEDEIARLRKYLMSGGTLVGDDSAGTPGYGFDASFRREMARLFEDLPLERLPSEHTVFRSFFLVRGMGGSRIVSPFLEGITLEKRTPVIYSPNGLGMAWARDKGGRWIHPVEPGGERQRRLAFQLGVNLVMYALCADYKQDRIHLPFLRQKI